MDDLAEGRVVAELQISSWPPPVTQTLLRKSDGRLTLAVRGKPSGRLRVSLEREGYAPIVVRTVHLRLRTPTVLKVQIVWRGDSAAVAAAGQIIGSTAEFDPVGVVSLAEIDQSAPPLDHVDNARMREVRAKQAKALVSGSMSAGMLAEQCLADLMPAVLVVEDLADLVRQGRSHHLAGLIAGIRRLVQGDEHGPALLQFCAGLLDAPLTLHVPRAQASGEDPVVLLAAAFDVSPERSAGHELAIDLDAWLRQEVRWHGTGLPVGWLLRQAELAIASRQGTQGNVALSEDMVRSSLVGDALCRLARCLGVLARRLFPERPQDAAEARQDVHPSGSSSGS
jgi:hypothetical protein